MCSICTWLEPKDFCRTHSSRGDEYYLSADNNNRTPVCNIFSRALQHHQNACTICTDCSSNIWSGWTCICARDLSIRSSLKPQYMHRIGIWLAPSWGIALFSCELVLVRERYSPEDRVSLQYGFRLCIVVYSLRCNFGRKNCRKSCNPLALIASWSKWGKSGQNQCPKLPLQSQGAQPYRF